MARASAPSVRYSWRRSDFLTRMRTVLTLPLRLYWSLSPKERRIVLRMAASASKSSSSRASCRPKGVSTVRSNISPCADSLMETVPSHLEIEIVTVGADEPVTSFADVSRACAMRATSDSSVASIAEVISFFPTSIDLSCWWTNWMLSSRPFMSAEKVLELTVLPPWLFRRIPASTILRPRSRCAAPPSRTPFCAPEMRDAKPMVVERDSWLVAAACFGRSVSAIIRLSATRLDRRGLSCCLLAKGDERLSRAS